MFTLRLTPGPLQIELSLPKSSDETRPWTDLPVARRVQVRWNVTRDVTAIACTASFLGFFLYHHL